MKFKKHVSKGDLVKIYTKMFKGIKYKLDKIINIFLYNIGNSSITINIKAFVDLKMVKLRLLMDFSHM